MSTSFCKHCSKSLTGDGGAQKCPTCGVAHWCSSTCYKVGYPVHEEECNVLPLGEKADQDPLYLMPYMTDETDDSIQEIKYRITRMQPNGILTVEDRSNLMDIGHHQDYAEGGKARALYPIVLSKTLGVGRSDKDWPKSTWGEDWEIEMSAWSGRKAFRRGLFRLAREDPRYLDGPFIDPSIDKAKAVVKGYDHLLYPETMNPDNIAIINKRKSKPDSRADVFHMDGYVLSQIGVYAKDPLPLNKGIINFQFMVGDSQMSMNLYYANLGIQLNRLTGGALQFSYKKYLKKKKLEYNKYRHVLRADDRRGVSVIMVVDVMPKAKAFRIVNMEVKLPGSVWKINQTVALEEAAETLRNLGMTGDEIVPKCNVEDLDQVVGLTMALKMHKNQLEQTLSHIEADFDTRKFGSVQQEYDEIERDLRKVSVWSQILGQYVDELNAEDNVIATPQIESTVQAAMDYTTIDLKVNLTRRRLYLTAIFKKQFKENPDIATANFEERVKNLQKQYDDRKKSAKALQMEAKATMRALNAVITARRVKGKAKYAAYVTRIEQLIRDLIEFNRQF